MSSPRRILIFVADGLRPDLFDPHLMPTVARLADQGVRSPEHHAVFPSHTRVNASSLATGRTPGGHGLVANTMLVAGASDDHIVDTSDYRHLQALEAHSRALLTPSLGDLLAQQGQRLAVAATSTPGASMLWTHRHLDRMVNVNSAFGLADLYSLREKLGEIPQESAPKIAQQHYIARAVTQLYLDDPDNRVIVMWMCEPDTSLHRFGLGSPQSRRAMQAVDEAVAHVLAAIEARGLREAFDLFFLSDHGHSTVLAHNTLGGYLAQARAELGADLPPLTTASDYIYSLPGMAEPAVSELQPLVAWLQAQPWCGAVLAGSREAGQLPGVLALDALWGGQTNTRRPLLAVLPAWDEKVNEHGVPGRVWALTTQAALRSSHGSASPYDMHALCIAQGPSFRAGVVSSLPTGAVDLLPTVLCLLQISPPARLDGRIWREMLADQKWDGPDPVLESVEAVQPGPAGHNPVVQLHRVGQTTYVHGLGL